MILQGARIFLLFLFFLPLAVSGQVTLVFQDTTLSALGISINAEAGSASADFDGDGDLDIGFAGGSKSVLLNNNGNGWFDNVGPFLPVLEYPYDGMIFKRADIDSDGDIDAVALIGSYYNSGRFAVLRNDGGAFSVQFLTDWAPKTSNLHVVDMNNDGRSDLLFSHGTGSGIPAIYRLLLQSVDGTFSDSGYQFHPQGGPDYSGVIQVGDIDGDGFQDVLFSGYDYASGQPAELFRNLKGRSFERKATLPTLYNPFFVDYNGDGKLDLAQPFGSSLRILQGHGNFVFDNPKDFTFNIVTPPRVEIADVDLNGWPDILLSQSTIRLLLNTGTGSYTDFGPLAGNYLVTAFLTDMENDGDLDIATGARIHKNLISTANPPPSTPTNLQLSRVGNEAVFTWSPSTDNNTPAVYMSYNLWVKDSGGKSWLHPATDPTGSFRRLVAPGNVGFRTSYTFNDLPAGNYTAKVQAVDASFALSGWSTELPFSISEGPSNLEVTRLLLNKVRLTWDDLTGEDGYVVERRSEDSGYTLIADLAPNTTEFTDDNLTYNNRYTYRVQARKSGSLSASSNTAEWNTNLFVPEDSTFPNVSGSLDVGDFNGDGRSDVLLYGIRIADGQMTHIKSSVFENTPAGWIEQTVGDPVASSQGEVKFLDINGDHRIDIFNFYHRNGGFRTEIFQNNPDFTFTLYSNYFSVYSRNIREGWDFDMDNDLDLFVNYATSYNYSSLLRKNSWSDYVPVPSMTTTICSYCSAQVTVGDFDADGDEDIIRAFQQNANYLHLNSPAGLRETPWIFESAANQGIDFDGDGLLDVFSTSVDSYTPSRLFKNLGVDTTGIPVLSLMPISFPKSYSPTSGCWADFDHDGDLDLLFSSGKGPYYDNVGNGQFVRSWLGFGIHPEARLIDFDSDGDMDLLSPTYGEPYMKLLVNQLISGGGITNTPPSAPTNLVAVQDTTGVHLRWDAPVDDHTRPEAITYDVALFQSGVEFSASVFDPVTGHRPKLSHGRVLHELTLNNLIPGQEYTWKIQAVDQSFAGSAVSAEATFTPIPFAPLVNDTTVTYCQYTYDPKNPVITALGENIEWFSDKLATHRIATGATYEPKWSQTVFVRQTVNGMAGVVKSVSIVVKDCFERIITSLEEAGASGIAVFPSPARESFTVAVGLADNASVSVYDLQGRLLLQKQVDEGTAELKVPVQGWPKGMYVVRVLSNRGSAATKIVLE